MMKRHQTAKSNTTINTTVGNYNNNNMSEEPSIMPESTKTTVYMRQSLNELHATLLCPLCHQLLQNPSTLSCAHTFCWKCIEAFSCKNNICPVKECGLPLAMTGSRQGSFLKINPSLETVLSSLQTICQALDKAPSNWWEHGKEDDDLIEEGNEEDDDNSSRSSCSSGEMITLDVSSPPGNLKNDDDYDTTDDDDDDDPNNLMKLLARYSDDDDDDEDD
ncbi:expressed unknown protein [Seminavis robusta]|uniref:RING-type domain-containing protein n=1 Tax=Seminavis robusta TaxID=568900 RepID=A0A9N8HCC8_9STRA|nr:expressed unknown protein [Seminavis robusta]|eukprot:Sro403_g135670.1 n/a (219) ;mRNA; f:31460-32195